MATWLDELAVPLGLPTRTLHALQLCLEEAVTNVVSHAFEPDTSHDVRIAVWRDDNALHAEVTDDGRAFDPLSRELPAEPVDIRSAEVGGLGIRLMRGFADQVSYRRADGMNRLRLSFRIN